MNSSISTPKLSQQKLRRLAARSTRVLARHKDKSALLASYEPRLQPVVERFVENNDAIGSQEIAARTAAEHRAEEVKKLLRSMRGWLAPLVRDVEQIDRSTFRVRQEIADDVVTQADRMLDAVRQHQLAGAPLPYADQLITEIEASITAVRTASEAAEQHFSLLQERRAQGRAFGVELETELIAFRRALASVIGTSHRDYQHLRSRTPELEDDEVTIEPAASATQSEAQPVTTQSEVGVRAVNGH